VLDFHEMKEPGNRYNVVLDFDTPLANDLGEMTETQLFGYLNDRPLLDRSPDEVLQELEEKGTVNVEFSRVPSGRPVQVKICRVSDPGP